MLPHCLRGSGNAPQLFAPTVPEARAPTRPGEKQRRQTGAGNPAFPTNWIYRLRTNRLYQRGLPSLKWLGAVFLFVNDALVPWSGSLRRFYANNAGEARVRLTPVR